MALCLTGHGLEDSHLVNPSLCLLVLSSFVIKFYSFVFYFFLCTIWLVCIPLQKVVFFFNTDPSYLLKKKKKQLWTFLGENMLWFTIVEIIWGLIRRQDQRRKRLLKTWDKWCRAFYEVSRQLMMGQKDQSYQDSRSGWLECI